MISDALHKTGRLESGDSISGQHDAEDEPASHTFADVLGLHMHLITMTDYEWRECGGAFVAWVLSAPPFQRSLFLPLRFEYL